MSHVTRTPLSRQGQKVKGQGHQAALLTEVLTRQAAAPVSVRTYCYVAVCRRGGLGGATRSGAHRGEWRGHIVAVARLQLVTRRKSGKIWKVRRHE